MLGGNGDLLGGLLGVVVVCLVVCLVVVVVCLMVVVVCVVVVVVWLVVMVVWLVAWWVVEGVVCGMKRPTGGQTAADDDQVSMVAMQGVLSGDIHVADECVHSLHGSLCHLWVRHWPQDVHKEQLGGSGKHPACAQAEVMCCLRSLPVIVCRYP